MAAVEVAGAAATTEALVAPEVLVVAVAIMEAPEEEAPGGLAVAAATMVADGEALTDKAAAGTDRAAAGTDKAAEEVDPVAEWAVVEPAQAELVEAQAEQARQPQKLHLGLPTHSQP